MGIYEMVVFPSVLLAMAGVFGRVVVHFSVADHTLRRRIAPKINWVCAIGVALLIGALLGRAVSETDFSKELQIAGLAIVILFLTLFLGYGNEDQQIRRV